MNTHKEKKISKSILVIVTAILLVILSISLFFFLRTLRGIRQDGWKHPPRNPMGMFLSGEGLIQGTGAIEGWMTFDFVNNSFHLPPQYLKDLLHIEDKKYPYISIDRGAKKAGFKKEDYLGMVVRAVEYYPQSTKAQ